MKEKDLLFLKNPLDVQDHNIGLVYKKIKQTILNFYFVQQTIHR